MTKQNHDTSDSKNKDHKEHFQNQINLKKVKSFLFDFDNTLVEFDENDLSKIIFKQMAEYFPEFAPDEFIKASIEATKAMIRSDGSKLLAKVYEDRFTELTDYPRDKLLPTINKFYSEEMPKLKKYVKIKKLAVKTVKALIKAEKEVVIATNPLFGSVAQKARLNWLNLNLAEDRAPILMTSADEFNFSKPRVEFYQQLIDTLQRDPEHMLMIGDSLSHDIIPAKAAGIKTYLITDVNPNNFRTFGNYELDLDLEPDAKGPLSKICNTILDFLEEERLKQQAEENNE